MQLDAMHIAWMTLFDQVDVAKNITYEYTAILVLKFGNVYIAILMLKFGNVYIAIQLFVLIIIDYRYWSVYWW